MKTLISLLSLFSFSAFAGTILEVQPANLANAPVTFNGQGRFGYYTNTDPNGRLFFVEFATKPGYGYTAHYSFTGPNKFVLDKPVFTETTNTSERLVFFAQVVWVDVEELPPVVINRSVPYTGKGYTNGIFWVQWNATAGQVYDVSASYMNGPALFPNVEPVTAETTGPMVAKSVRGFPQVFLHVEQQGTYPMPPPTDGSVPLGGPAKTTIKTNVLVITPKLVYPPPAVVRTNKP